MSNPLPPRQLKALSGAVGLDRRSSPVQLLGALGVVPPNRAGSSGPVCTHGAPTSSTPVPVPSPCPSRAILVPQVKQLRQEVTAILTSANAERGDEVVLILNSGGGTVTGYGLSASQLMRLKARGLKLTICVEEVLPDPPTPHPLVVVRSPCQENYPADAHPSAHKSVLESANPA